MLHATPFILGKDLAVTCSVSANNIKYGAKYEDFHMSDAALSNTVWFKFVYKENSDKVSYIQTSFGREEGGSSVISDAAKTLLSFTGVVNKIRNPTIFHIINGKDSNDSHFTVGTHMPREYSFSFRYVPANGTPTGDKWYAEGIFDPDRPGLPHGIRTNGQVELLNCRVEPRPDGVFGDLD